MWLEIDDVVVVVRTLSVPRTYSGRYGIVKGFLHDKVIVEFKKSVRTDGFMLGSLSHTVAKYDLEKVGVVKRGVSL